MEEISIELILLAVLGLVFIVDFVLKGINKSSFKKKEVISYKEPSKDTKASRKTNKYVQFIIERPRNIALYLFFVWVIKILINASVFKTYWNEGKIVENKPRYFIVNRGRYGEFDFGEYIKYSFEVSLESYLYSFIVLTFIVWQLNSYIKKR